jgi:proteasome lid subunit RPN8/RPN11
VVGVGKVDGVFMHPRELFHMATQMKTSAIGILHNHPGGVSTPSVGDRRATGRAMQVGQYVNIPVRFHIVASKHGYQDILDPKNRLIPWSQVPALEEGRATPVLDAVQRDKFVPRSWDRLIDKQIITARDLGRIGRALLNPVDQIALAATMNFQQVVTGIFPIAVNEVSGETLRTILRLAVSTSAVQIAIMAGRDGHRWQEQVELLHKSAKRVLWRRHGEDEPMDEVDDETYRKRAEVRIFDTVSVSPKSYRSMSEHGSVRWGDGKD